ncbi:hypothetical protein [Methylobacterium sp. J-076]|uniref:hypothetical protein n=1 Tax=Methylobacterium sp. J-076 TaxID=2836655 RepID=UPI001FB8AC1A|nr:hypothetical protein [Methylobacterium sp. J-076]MCJ2011485.1 hypothetical protein [Methylobacterium sp. J-076]
MAATLADHVARAAMAARRHCARFPGAIAKDALPWAVIEAFDADVRGHVERDPRIEDERDRVLIAAVKLAETPSDEDDEVATARGHLVDAIDYLEQAVLRFGVINRQGAKLRLGWAGQRVGQSSEG